MIPFAVVGSERNVLIDGKTVRGRKNRWGVVNVEDERHCEFVYLRNFLTRFVHPLLPLLICSRLFPSTGRISRTSSRRLRRSITRPSGQNSCSRSRSRPTPARRLLRSRRGRRRAKAPACWRRCAVRGVRYDTPFRWTAVLVSSFWLLLLPPFAERYAR